jgi:tRNA wybutosine-synthesizing protein 3
MNSEETRFAMTKKRHFETFNKAVKEKKADSAFVPLCSFVAKTKNFFTSSCCSGRILLLELQKDEKKLGSNFHRKWHRPVKLEEVWNALQENVSGELWFKMEPLILHLGTDNLEHANIALMAIKKAGVKRGGIITAKQGKFLFEIEGTQRISVPVKSKGKILVEKKFLAFLVKKANAKIKKNCKTIKRLEKELKKVLK